jgi:hypothetical protein
MSSTKTNQEEQATHSTLETSDTDSSLVIQASTENAEDSRDYQMGVEKGCIPGGLRLGLHRKEKAATNLLKIFHSLPDNTSSCVRNVVA